MKPIDNAKRLLETMEAAGRDSSKTPSHSELALALGDMVHLYEDLEHRINTPEIIDAIEAIKLESEHQRQKWDDSQKTDADWGMLVLYLTTKAHYNPPTEDTHPVDKKLHRILTVAAAAINWHAALKGKHGSRFVPPTGAVPALQDAGDGVSDRPGEDEGRRQGR
jgi:hypothetical protein